MSKTYCIALTALLLVHFASGRQMPQPKPLVKAPEGSPTTGHHIVVLKEDTSIHNVMERVKKMSDDVTVHRYTEHVGKTMTVDAPDHVVEQIRHLDEVSHIEEEDFAFGASGDSCRKVKDGSIVPCASENNLWFLDRLNQPNLPLDNIFTDTFNVKEEETVDVYVLDSGIAFEHSEFENRAKYAGYDPIDQYHYTTLSTPDYKPHHGSDCNGHGTLVASLIGGKTYGTAKKVNLYSVRVLDCQLSGRTSVILDGLNFITTEVSERKRPAIVSMALRGSSHSSLNSAINTLHDSRNVLIVGSAGNTQNEACSFFPASHSYVLRVGASDTNDTIYERSNYGSCVDIFAPGDEIEGADMSCPDCKTASKSGTSLATALVCGIAAVHLSRSPLIKPADLKQKIIDISHKDVLNLASVPGNTPNRLASFDCGASIVLDSYAEEVIINSPNFPQHYPNNLRCMWTIYGPKESYVYIQFSFIKVEKKYDWLNVCNGTSCIPLSGDYAETLCGYTSSSSSLTLELTTDQMTTSTGFKAKFTAARAQPKLEGCSLPENTTALQLDVKSQGTNSGDRFSISKDWEEVFGGRRRGINIAIIDEVSGEMITTRNFDTYSSSSQSLYLAREIENLHPGALVAMASSGDVDNNLEDRAKRAIRTLGSRYSYSMNSVSSWSLVGVKGLASGRAIETINYNHAVDISTQVKVQPYKQYGLRIEVMSSGSYSGATFFIKIDGKDVEFTSKDGSNIGLNVAVFDENSGDVLDTKVFNTHAEVVADYTPSDAFVDFINALPNGRVVAIAIKGDGITHLTEEAKKACESIGSRLIRYAQIERSWAIIGQKGANTTGQVAESVKYYSRAWTTYYLPIGSQRNSAFCKISASSSSHWTRCDYSGHIGSYIAVGDSVYPSNLCTQYGIAIGHIQENSCEFESSTIYDTHRYPSHSNLLAGYIDNIPDGRIVVASFGIDGNHNLQSNAEAALEQIGSAHIKNVGTWHAWAIIGRKGAAPGSVPEVYQDVDNPHTAAISASVPLKAPELPSVSSCDDSIYPLSCHAGLEV